VVVYGAGDESIFVGPGGDGLEGISEYTITDIPLKPPLLANCKSNNYMLNVLTAMSSQDRGGKFGVLLDSKGDIAESCVLNCVFITEDRRLLTPPFDAILAGTTVRKVMELAAAVLVPEGALLEVTQAPVSLETAKKCVEMMMLGGDHHLMPVTKWDDILVGTGEVGEVTKRIMDLLNDDMRNGEGDHYKLVYTDADETAEGHAR
jgi:branched-subunit amino acid aminotransferase/4-amino-4-deoxychorismate lyase